MFWDILIIAGILWVVMSVFNFVQSTHIRNIYKTLGASGQVYFGRDAGFLRTRYYAFAAIDNKNIVRDATLLKSSRIITLSKVEPLTDLINKDLLSTEASSINLNPRAEIAVKKLIANYNKYRNK